MRLGDVATVLSNQAHVEHLAALGRAQQLAPGLAAQEAMAAHDQDATQVDSTDQTESGAVLEDGHSNHQLVVRTRKGGKRAADQAEQQPEDEHPPVVDGMRGRHLDLMA